MVPPPGSFGYIGASMGRAKPAFTLAIALMTAAVVSFPSAAVAGQVGVSQTRFELPSSNGHGAIMVDLGPAARRVTHFREHLFAAEEPVIDARGQEVWGGSDFEAIYTRDLLFDAYFGLRDSNGQGWLTEHEVDTDASGYAGWTEDTVGGTGMVTMVQQFGDLEATQYFFAPFDLPHASLAMVMRVTNTGDDTIEGAQAFSLHNFHLGYGRPDSPWDLFNDIGNNGETLTVGFPAEQTLLERGFAGATAIRALGPVAHYGTGPGADVFAIVDSGSGDLPDNPPAVDAVTGAVGALQFDLGSLAPGQDAWVAVVAAHHGDPFGEAEALQWVDTWIDGRDAQGIVDYERARWAEFQDGLLLPGELDVYEESLLRQSAAMLRMGQVREEQAYLRQWQSEDGQTRRTRFPSKDDPTPLPGWVQHNASGAILASLPPGNWTYAWIRDGSYATSAMALLGMNTEAHDSLQYYLDAEAGRFAEWKELAGYDLPPYQMTLVRYYGFGVEETDFNAFGPNLEFDGFGLFLWALANYEGLTGDTSISDERWPLIAEGIGDVLVALVEPETGLIRPDSSIWETHWNGRERHWTYTNITAVRGLCDAATMAERVGDDERAQTYRDTALALRAAIADELTDRSGALVSNREELQTGQGYYDAAVLDALAMGLFDPTGTIATSTLASMDQELLTDASGVGWARNDDRWDHADAEDISPWGSDYDSAEWVITDLRGAMATRAAGDTTRSDAILNWVLAQSLSNFLMVAETYEEQTGEYKFNHPMLGFGAGAYALAVGHRNGDFADPACGAYYDEGDDGGTGTGTSGGADTDTGDDGNTTEWNTDDLPGDDSPPDDDGESSISISASLSDSSDATGDGVGQASDSGCSCRSGPRGSGGGWWLWLPGFGLFIRRRRRRLGVTLAAAATVGIIGCNGDDGSGIDSDGTTGGPSSVTITTTVLPADDSGDATSTGVADSTTDGDSSGDSTDTTDTGGVVEVDVCPTEFVVRVPADATNVRVAGEWNDFELAEAATLAPQGEQWQGTVELPPGLHAYKVVYDNGSGEPQWVLDDDRGRRKYVDEVENSAVLVRDCNLPSTDLTTSTAAAEGTYDATLQYIDGAAGTGPDPDATIIALRHDFDAIDVPSGQWSVDATSGDIEVALEGLEPGKYTLSVSVGSLSGHVSEPQRLIFWIEDEPFQWDDALIYMVMLDRYRNGEPTNDIAGTPGSDPMGDFWGGDLQGLTQSIEEGRLDALGVRALWLTPWQTNPEDAFVASDGQHMVTGYHGYWPTQARQVDPRFGGEEALRDLVRTAHAHGIRILQDYVINHVHQEHEYVQAHPEWFRTGCVCGTDGCDWTADALQCQFTPYMPDINHTVPEANAAFVDDAVWWVDEFDLDGLRVDAVKHVEEVATRNLAASVRETFEAAGTRYFLMGETAMGWSDCADPCNDDNYGTIARYVGPHGLDGQFDFVLYHGVSYRTFAHGDNGMLHADFWFAHGQDKWPEGAIMTPYVGSHDTPRFTSLADYRGQDGEHDRSIPGNQWDNVAVEPGEQEAYLRTRVAFAWLLGLPGAPLLYYGDEYGQWGGADPNNRLMWRPPGQLSPWEAETLTFIEQLGQARQQVRALRRGRYLSLGATEDLLVFGRLERPGQAAIVGINRADTEDTLSVNTVQLGWPADSELVDVLGGPGATIGASGTVEVTVPAHGAVVLVP